MPSKAEFIAQARKYIGTPYRHQGRAHLGGKKQALDCIGLLMSVWEDLGLIDRTGLPFERNQELYYGPSPTKNAVHDACKRRLILKAEAPNIAILPSPGDVISVLVKYRDFEPGVTCHVAIVTELPSTEKSPELGMLHSLASIGRVAEQSLSSKMVRRIEGIFSVPGLT